MAQFSLMVLSLSSILSVHTSQPSVRIIHSEQRLHQSFDKFTSTRELDPIPECIKVLVNNSSPEAPNIMLHHLNGGYNPSLLILVESTVDKRSWRDAVRNSWKMYTQATHSSQSVKLLFAVPCKQLGSQERHVLTEESVKHRDMALFFEVASTMAGSGRLIHYLMVLRDVVSYRFLLRTYDSYYIQVPALLKELVQFTDKAIYMGYFMHNKSPNNEQNWYLCPTLVPHADSNSYVLSQTVVLRLLKQYEYLSYYNDDSVSVSLWLSSHKDVLFQHNTKFNTVLFGDKQACRNKFILSPMSSEQDMMAVHDNVINHGNLCVQF